MFTIDLIFVKCIDPYQYKNIILFSELKASVSKQ